MDESGSCSRVSPSNGVKGKAVKGEIHGVELEESCGGSGSGGKSGAGKMRNGAGAPKKIRSRDKEKAGECPKTAGGVKIVE